MLNVLSVLLQRKFEGVADKLNQEFYDKDPKSYPFKRESEECYNKWRSLKATYVKEAAKACKHNLSLSETGQPRLKRNDPPCIDAMQTMTVRHRNTASKLPSV